MFSAKGKKKTVNLGILCKTFNRGNELCCRLDKRKINPSYFTSSLTLLFRKFIFLNASFIHYRCISNVTL